MPRSNDHHEAIALLADEDERNFVEKQEAAPPPANQGPLSFFLTRTIPLLLLIDFVTFIYFLIPPTTRTLDSLPLRNTYVGLAELYATQQIKSTKHDSIVNKALFAAQVSSTDPDTIFPQDEHEWLSPEGTLAPPDRHLLLSKHVRTIYQFRTLDFGMDSCQLALRLPVGTDWSDIDVFECGTSDSAQQVNPRKMSWRSKPHCGIHTGTFHRDSSGEKKLGKFDCEWGKTYTFETRCENCNIDVWSNQNETWGLFMYQHQTI